MKFAVVPVLMIIGTLTVQARPATSDLTCAAATALVNREGGFVLTTGAGTYDRYVSDRKFCLANEYTRLSWVKTRNNGQCAIGYTCGSRENQSGR